MLEKIRNNRKNGKKGFTLVELIVVLVILAILMAILIPSMVGWIDKAKEKQVLLEARTAYLAVQTISSEEYAKDATMTTLNPTQTAKAEVLAQVETGSITAITIVSGKVTAMTYTGATHSVTMAAGVWGDPVKK